MGVKSSPSQPKSERATWTMERAHVRAGVYDLSILARVCESSVTVCECVAVRFTRGSGPGCLEPGRARSWAGIAVARGVFSLFVIRATFVAIWGFCRRNKLGPAVHITRVYYNLRAMKRRT